MRRSPLEGVGNVIYIKSTGSDYCLGYPANESLTQRRRFLKSAGLCHDFSWELIREALAEEIIATMLEM